MKQHEAIESGQFCIEGVCVTCLFAIVNSDVSGAADDWNSEKFDRTMSEFHVIQGHPHDVPQWFECSHSPDRCPDDVDCDCAVTEFSRSACGACGDTDHGYREDMTFIRRDILNNGHG